VFIIEVIYCKAKTITKLQVDQKSVHLTITFKKMS